MEEDTGNKAPVTRLRRRLSIEQPDDVKSPSAVGTPTKKRGGRLAAKPQLDLIDENAPVSSPRRTTRKSLARDAVEEEKPITPSRRSTRVKSNTSIVSETATQVTDSPRAKRATRRRSSILESDNETAPLTPARQTRRTKKDSTSSVEVDSAAVHSVKKQIVETISKEPENKTTNTSNEAQENCIEVITNPRKSPRLAKKLSQICSPKVTENKENLSMADQLNLSRQQSLTMSDKNTDIQKSSETEETDKNTSLQQKFSFVSETNTPPQKTDKRLSSQKKSLSPGGKPQEPKLNSSRENLDSLVNITVNMPSQETPNLNNLNCTTDTNISNIESHDEKAKLDKSESEITLKKSNRNRTKSWTTISVPSSKENSFCSDSEISRKKNRKSGNKFAKNNGAGDVIDTSIKTDDTKKDKGNISVNKKKRISEKSFTENKETFNESPKNDTVSPVTGKDGFNIETDIFTKDPKDMQSEIFIDDTDSNASAGQQNVNLQESEDQCVPVVKAMNIDSSSHKDLQNIPGEDIQETVNTSMKLSYNDSCEPMDIDETIPDNSVLNKSLNSASTHHTSTTHTGEKLLTPNTSQSKNLSISSSNGSSTNKLKKSKRKSSLKSSLLEDIPNQSIGFNDLPDEQKENSYKNCTELKTQNQSRNSLSKSKIESPHNGTLKFEKSQNENKSTLILSQIKDLSTNESKSPKRDTTTKSVHDITKESTNKNISVNDMVNTPLKQIKVQKLGMQTSTPVIDSASDIKHNVSKGKNKLNKSAVSKKSNISSSDSDYSKSEEDNVLKKKVNITKNKSKDGNSLSKSTKKNDSDSEHSDTENRPFIEEAEDAGDGYESGDSRSEEGITFENENEIVERGETLTSSNEEFSDDSDYEKDSFVVSSNEEDEQLLSGSGDDLNSSDNELTMSVKSKQKYNESKIKEQKRASREMFEARHNISSKSLQSNSDSRYIKNRSRLDSALLNDSEETVTQPPKKNKRMRLDSSQDNSLTKSISNKSLTENKSQIYVSEESFNQSSTKSASKVKSKKNKSKSLIDDDEKEITVCSKLNETSSLDPLSIEIKSEVKTPQKDSDQSALYTSAGNIEKVKIDENKTLIATNESVDPLFGADVEYEESDESSDDNGILQNYDMMLENLNKENKSKNKHNNTLNLQHKQSKDSKNPIVDQLNLTQPKTAQTKKQTFKDRSSFGMLNESNKTVKANELENMQDDQDDSSDIDLKLLFSEDSNDPDEDSHENEAIIPLKRTEAKTDISIDINTQKISAEPGSTKKKKRNLSVTGSTEKAENENLSFFIDTEGMHEDKNKSLNQSKKNNSLNTSKKNKSLNTSKNVEIKEGKNEKESESDDEGPMEMSFVREKNTNRVLDGQQKILDTSKFSPLLKTPGSQKKKKKISESSILSTENITNISAVKSPKNVKKLLQTNEESEERGKHNLSVDSTKKKKQKMVSESEVEIAATENEEAMQTKKRKRISSMSQNLDVTNQDAITLNQSTVLVQKKKRKVSGNDDTAITIPLSGGSKETGKKRKRHGDTDDPKVTKVKKDNFLDTIHISRLPSNILDKLDEKPSKEYLLHKKSIAISTTDFLVENSTKRKNKPSNYLEESIYLNDNTPDERKTHKKVKKPKVLPFIPTASTSNSGFTTNFKVNVISKETKFVAQSSNINNFKNDYLYNKKIKRLGTYELYKKNRNIKMSKF